MFQEMELSSPKTKKSLLFSQKKKTSHISEGNFPSSERISYILGNETFYP